jgi:hypothetical protein
VERRRIGRTCWWWSDLAGGDTDPPVEQGKLCVTVSCNGCGYLKIGRALDALEREAPGLGSAFYWSLVHALYRVMRIYDHDDALM